MSIGGGGSTGSSSGTQAPWSPQQPYILQGFQKAQSELLNKPAQYYPGSTVTPFSSQTQQGMSGLESTANSSQLPGEASSQIGSTLGGGYLGSPEAWTARTRNNFADVMNPNANVMAGMAANDSANATGGVATNPNASAYNQNAGVSSSLATNQNMNASNPYAGMFNPYAGAKADVGYNPYLAQGANDYIGNVTNAISRSVIPQVQGAYGSSGRSGESPLAQGAVAKGIADAVAPYQFGSAESEAARRFSGGESLAGRQQSASESQAQRLYGAGTDYTNQLYNSGEALAGRQFAGGETQAARQQGISDALTQQQYTAGQEQAGRQFSAGESMASRDQGARDALAGRQFSAGESLAGSQRAEASAQAARQFSAGNDLINRETQSYENSLTRGMSAYDAERQRQMQAAGMAPAIDAAQYSAPNAMLQAGAMQDQKATEYTQDDVNRFNFGQTAQDDAIRQYMDVIQNNLGSVLKSSQSGANFGVKTGK